MIKHISGIFRVALNELQLYVVQSRQYKAGRRACLRRFDRKQGAHTWSQAHHPSYRVYNSSVAHIKVSARA